MNFSSDRPISWAFLSAVIVLVALAMVWQQVKVRALERESSALRMAIDRLRYDNGMLDMKIHKWTAPSNLGLLARHDYGMSPPKPLQKDILK